MTKLRDTKTTLEPARVHLYLDLRAHVNLNLRVRMLNWTGFVLYERKYLQAELLYT